MGKFNILSIFCFVSIWFLKALRYLWLQLTLSFGYRSCKCPFAKGKSIEINKQQSTNRNSSVQDPLPFDDIPTARGLPVVGTFFELIAAGAAPKLHKYIDKRHQQLGAIFRERLGGTQDAVFIASASQMRSMFLYEGQHPKHPLPDAWTLYNKEHSCQRGLFFMDGMEWQQNRRILNKFLLSGNMDWINEHIDECTDQLITSWRTVASDSEQDYVVVKDLEQQLYRWAIQVICSIMFGSVSLSNTKSIEIELALQEFSQIVHKIFECSALLMNFPPALAKMLNLRMWKDFELNVSQVLSKGSEIIDLYIAHNIEESKVSISDSVALFYRLQQVGMPLTMIKRIFVDLVIAAGDTTAYTSEWALYLLSQNMELQKRIAKEAVLYVDNTKDTVNTARGLIKETLRLYPVAPFIGRYLATDAVLGNFHIKRNTLVLLSLYTAGRDAAHFSKPLKVNPDRWKRDSTTGDLQDVLQAHGTLPFAIGNRSCIGRKIATTQLETLITAISTNFYLKCLNEKPIDCILRLVTVPDQQLQLAIKIRDEIY